MVSMAKWITEAVPNAYQVRGSAPCTKSERSNVILALGRHRAEISGPLLVGAIGLRQR